MARSGLPSPLKSPATTVEDSKPAAKVCWGAKVGVVAPVGVVFSSTDTVPDRKLAMARSGLPSPLRSPTATESGALPVAKVRWAAKLGTVAPVGVIFSNTDTVSVPNPPFVAARSGLPSPLKSPTATELSALLVVKVRWGAKLGIVAPVGVVLSNTDTVL